MGLKKLIFHLRFIWIPSINGRGANKLESRWSKNFCPPPLQDRVKLFTPLLLNGGNFLCHPFSMAKISSSCVKTTPILFVPPPFSIAKIPPPPFFFQGVELHLPPPYHFEAPLPIINDWSLRQCSSFFSTRWMYGCLCP